MTEFDRRFVIKFSGEALGRPECGTWESDYLDSLGEEISTLAEASGSQIAIILGGGNILRGSQLKQRIGLHDGVVADNCGMLATVINCHILQDVLESRHGLQTRLMTAWSIPDIGEVYIRRRAIRHMEKGRIVILAGGTGKPDCSTDKALTQYGHELQADLLLKASKVDGIFTDDPKRNPEAEHIPYLTYREFLAEPQRYQQILDRSAVTQAEQHGLTIRVFNARQRRVLWNVIQENGICQFSDVGPEHHQIRPRIRWKSSEARYVGVGPDAPDRKDPDVFEVPAAVDGEPDGTPQMTGRTRLVRTGSQPVSFGDETADDVTDELFAGEPGRADDRDAWD